MQSLIHYLHNLKPLSPALASHLQTNLRYWIFEKYRPLRNEPGCHTLWFITRGLVGCLDETNDTKHYTAFYKEQDFIISPCALSDAPCTKNLVALENTHAFALSIQSVQHICSVFPELNYHLRIILQQQYTAIEKRITAMHNRSPKEKYQYLLQHHSELINRVSVKDLATFIGVHKETLSRVRGKI